MNCSIFVASVDTIVMMWPTLCSPRARPDKRNDLRTMFPTSFEGGRVNIFDMGYSENAYSCADRLPNSHRNLSHVSNWTRLDATQLTFHSVVGELKTFEPLIAAQCKKLLTILLVSIRGVRDIVIRKSKTVLTLHGEDTESNTNPVTDPAGCTESNCNSLRFIEPTIRVGFDKPGQQDFAQQWSGRLQRLSAKGHGA
jgi:hypothetical protein